MEEKKIYIHIGFHKAASSTIQAGLDINRGLLEEKGYLVPKTGCPFDKLSGHHNLVWEIRNDPRFDSSYGTADDLIAEIKSANCQNILLSSEDFDYLNDEEKKFLKAIFAPDKIKIIVYLREQSSWYKSSWLELVKRMETVAEFETWINENEIKIWRAKKAENYLDFVKKWEAVFGNENIIVRVLERGQIVENVLYDFFCACDVQTPQIYQVPDDMNVSPSGKTLNYIRMFGSKLKKSKFYKDPKFRHYVAWIINRYAQNNWDLPKPVTAVPREFYDIVKGKFEESNNWLARDYLSQEKLFYSEPKFEDNQEHSYSVEDLTGLHAHLLVAILNWNEKHT